MNRMRYSCSSLMSVDFGCVFYMVVSFMSCLGVVSLFLVIS